MIKRQHVSTCNKQQPTSNKPQPTSNNKIKNNNHNSKFHLRCVWRISSAVCGPPARPSTRRVLCRKPGRFLSYAPEESAQYIDVIFRWRSFDASIRALACATQRDAGSCKTGDKRFPSSNSVCHNVRSKPYKKLEVKKHAVCRAGRKRRATYIEHRT